MGRGPWYLYEITESGTCMKLPCVFMRETYSGIHLEIIKVSLLTVKQAWI
jgi:hypothetical protein